MARNPRPAKKLGLPPRRFSKVGSKTVAVKTFRELFTHYGLDRHPDHRVVSELTWNTFRNHLVAELEIPKYEGDLERPNIYVTAKAFFMVL